MEIDLERGEGGVEWRWWKEEKGENNYNSMNNKKMKRKKAIDNKTCDFRKMS